MAKRTKVSVDDFAFFDEEEAQPLNLIAKSIQKSEAIHEPKLSQSEVKALAEREQSVSNASPKPLVEYIKTESKQSLNGVENIDSNLLIGRERQLLDFLVFESFCDFFRRPFIQCKNQ